ncbi:MAG: 3-phosphoshikimate 1-carboxyvinyltransferase [Ruminococcaceae bacterium]|nr:3-phosphoshikimate 1-carboxyvinyltransferase [Oscillospiraceae bacterium]
MNVKIQPKKLSGTVSAIPSKSEAHRLLICAALADGDTVLELDRTSEDIEATARCLRSLGAKIVRSDNAVTVTPAVLPEEAPLLDCGESGSTFRFMLPVASALLDKASFTGGGRLPNRPISDLVNAMKAHGVAFSADMLPFFTEGRLQPGRFEIPGNVSSQYITGLLLAMPLLAGDSEIKLTVPMESGSYVDITVEAMKSFGVSVEGQWSIKGKQRYQSPGNLKVGGDWSNSAFFLCAGALGERITVTGLNRDSAQGDKAVVDILRRFGAEVTENDGNVTVSPGELRGVDIDASDIPDLLPVLSVVAANAKGQTRFFNAQRLKLKESDRLESTAELLRSLGGRADWNGEVFTVYGGRLTGGEVKGWGDHRIVMSAAIAAIGCTDAVTVMGAEAVNKSYPDFFEDYNLLGGESHVI